MEMQEGNPIETPAARALITIRLEADGRINVNFPNDAMLTFGMLKMAENTIARHFEALNAPRVVQANGVPNGALRPGPVMPRRLLG